MAVRLPQDLSPFLSDHRPGLQASLPGFDGDRWLFQPFPTLVVIQEMANRQEASLSSLQDRHGNPPTERLNLRDKTLGNHGEYTGDFPRPFSSLGKVFKYLTNIRHPKILQRRNGKEENVNILLGQEDIDAAVRDLQVHPGLPGGIQRVIHNAKGGKDLGNLLPGAGGELRQSDIQILAIIADHGAAPPGKGHDPEPAGMEWAPMTE